MSSSSVMQQALPGDNNNNNQDEASWSLYDYGSMYVNKDFMQQRDAIVHGDITRISFYGSPRDPTTPDYTDDDWKRIGIALGECSKLKEFNLGCIKLTKEVAKYLFKNRGKHTWPDLDIIEMSSGVREIRAFCPTLKSFPSLDTLDLSGCCGLGIQAANLVGGLLNQIRISKLTFGSRHNNLKDDGLKCILEASNAKQLVQLSVGGGYTQAGYDDIASFIRREDTQLQILDVNMPETYNRLGGETGMSKEDIQCMFIDSIRTPSKLELITIRDMYCAPTDVVKEKLLKLVCNTESIQSLIDSNHRFFSIGHGWGGSGLTRDECKELAHAFELNKEVVAGGCIARAIRRKVRSFYFQKPEFDVTYFVDMDANLLPYLLDLVTRIEFRDDKWLNSRWSSIDSRWSSKKEPFLVPSYNNLNGIYRLVKNCPVALFSFPSPQVFLKQKDDTIMQLKAANETMRLQLEEQAREIEQLKLGGPTPSNKRAKTDDDNATTKVAGDTESRFAALEADVALLKQNMKQS